MRKPRLPLGLTQPHGEGWRGNLVHLDEATIRRDLAHVVNDPRVMLCVVTETNAIHTQVDLMFDRPIERAEFAQLLGAIGRQPRYDVRKWMPMAGTA